MLTLGTLLESVLGSYVPEKALPTGRPGTGVVPTANDRLVPCVHQMQGSGKTQTSVERAGARYFPPPWFSPCSTAHRPLYSPHSPPLWFRFKAKSAISGIWCKTWPRLLSRLFAFRPRGGSVQPQHPTTT